MNSLPVWEKLLALCIVTFSLSSLYVVFYGTIKSEVTSDERSDFRSMLGKFLKLSLIIHKYNSIFSSFNIRHVTLKLVTTNDKTSSCNAQSDT